MPLTPTLDRALWNFSRAALALWIDRGLVDQLHLEIPNFKWTASGGPGQDVFVLGLEADRIWASPASEDIVQLDENKAVVKLLERDPVARDRAGKMVTHGTWSTGLPDLSRLPSLLLPRVFARGSKLDRPTFNRAIIEWWDELFGDWTRAETVLPLASFKADVARF